MTAERSIFDLIAEPRGDASVGLVQAALDTCDVGLLVLRSSVPVGRGAAEILMRLEPWILARESASEWRGTVLFDHTTLVHRVRLVGESAAILESAVAGIHEGQQPARPEDLCFLRADGTTWLGSIAHERDAWLELTEAEAAALAARIPKLALRPREPGA